MFIHIELLLDYLGGLYWYTVLTLSNEHVNFSTYTGKNPHCILIMMNRCVFIITDNLQ